MATESRLISVLRIACVYLYDILAVLLAWFVSFLLRSNFEFAGVNWVAVAKIVGMVLPLHLAAFHYFGLYKGIWVFASLPDLLRIMRAVAAATVASVVALVMVRYSGAVPRSVYLTAPLLLLLLMGGARAFYRLWKEHRLYGRLIAEGAPVLVIGGGQAGANLVRELSRSPEWKVVGILDDDTSKHGRSLLGHNVLGSVSEVERWAAATKATHVIIAMPSVPKVTQVRIYNQCVSAGLKVMVIPSFENMVRSDVKGLTLREIGLEDLLGRDPVEIDCANIGHMLTGRAVLVSGAGGSIGAELCRQIAEFKPASIIAYELNEFALYRLMEEFASSWPEVQLVPITGDVKDAAWLEEVFRQYSPSVVFHAAAYKHVPLMEDFNAWQAMRNNVLGTWRIAQAAINFSVERFVLVSTDKAVNPTNVMGATKRLAEMVCMCAQQRGDCATRFECVRFGNVLGSAGSVVPKFMAQISSGGPVTVTHPEITRFFMSIPEAAQLVLQAAAMGEGGEIFVLDMGQPVRIADLARDLIKLSGASLDEVRIEYTGLRPGEKLYEELLADSESTRPTHHSKLRVAKSRAVDLDIVGEVLDWLRTGKVATPQEIKRNLRRWVPEYSPALNRPELHVAPVQMQGRKAL